MRECEILYENGNYWVRAADKRKGKDMGYEVLKTGGTHSTRCAIIGFEGQLGLVRAIAEADKRASALP